MTFGKDQDAKIEGIKGGRKFSSRRNDKVSEARKKDWKNPEYRKEHLKHIEKYMYDKESQSSRGKISRKHENEQVEMYSKDCGGNIFFASADM